MTDEKKQEPYDCGDPDQVKSRREKLKTRELQSKAALRKFLCEPAGRMWMWDLLARCGVYHPSFSTDPLVMAFNEGRRDVGNFLAGQINRIDPEIFVKMATENRGEKSN